ESDPGRDMEGGRRGRRGTAAPARYPLYARPSVGFNVSGGRVVRGDRDRAGSPVSEGQRHQAKVTWAREGGKSAGIEAWCRWMQGTSPGSRGRNPGRRARPRVPDGVDLKVLRRV